MTATHALRCDHVTITRAASANPYFEAVVDRVACLAVSRDARSRPVLDTITARDGWTSLPDGTHRCPEHAVDAVVAA